MTKDKLIELFQKEKIRIIQQVINPMIDVVSHKEYDNFFKCYIAININNKIADQQLDLQFLNPTNFSTLDSAFQSKKYITLYDEVINKILEVNNWDAFKMVFGDPDYKPWALNFYKFVIYKYYESKNLTNIKWLLENDMFNVNSYVSKKNFEDFVDVIFKTIYGYNVSGIFNLEYWQQVTGISRKQYDYFAEIVSKNNPVPTLINSFLYYITPLKNEKYGKSEIHVFRTFTPVSKPEIKDKNIAYEWISNYLACITLNQKIVIGLWKSIQNLVFGSTIGKTVVVMRNISEININIQSNWKLDKTSENFFKYLKYQVFFKLEKPSNFDSFIKQDYEKIQSLVEPYAKKYGAMLKEIKI